MVFEKIVEEALYVLKILARSEAVVDVDPKLVGHDVLGPPAPSHRGRDDLVEG